MLSVAVMSEQQFLAAISEIDQIQKIYIDSDLYMELHRQEGMKCVSKIRAYSSKMYVKMPAVIRFSDQQFLETVCAYMKEDAIAGVLCPTVDAVGYFRQANFQGDYVSDASLYSWNAESTAMKLDFFKCVTLPYELNSKEIKTLCKGVEDPSCFEAIIYGKIPLMVTANCVKLTTGNCDHNRSRRFTLEDRKNVTFSAYTNCNHCYNVLYNHIPLFLYEGLWMLEQDGITRYRLEFTDESGETVKTLIETFSSVITSKNWKKTIQDTYYPGYARELLGTEVTGGHFKRGVE